MTNQPLAPGSTIGIFGGGQLGRMLSIAAANLGFRTHIYCDQKDQPAAQLANQTTVAPYDDMPALEKFAALIDVATFEFENIPTEALEYIASHTRLAPAPNSLKATRDRLVEKQFIERLGIPVAPFVDIEPNKGWDHAEIKAISDKINFPAILKTRRFGYDGKGQTKLNAPDELASAIAKLDNTPAILEQMINFERELSIIATRSHNGDIAFYDLTENVHEHGILRHINSARQRRPKHHYNRPDIRQSHC